ncbi:hypothetical protein [Roseateles asaccharophilus]|uniref:Uncharacterized protein n=1 Tax=Roseateles asaccharophilus TaxID=582607 RepID=A0ABU2AEU3_9BURK|nr:hypothetical protein [Roseateles asaccharophilus]MDR7335495.1 hypothetical protein [Roseateles asaccharophilus]
MADHSSPFETAVQAAPSRPLLSALTRWWPGAADASAADPVLGYESAQPWTLDDVPGDDIHGPY